MRCGRWLLLLLCVLLGGGVAQVDAAAEGPTRLYLPFYVIQPNKLGIAGGSAEWQAVLGASWYYAWCPSPDPTGLEAVPMIWGPRDYGAMPEGNSRWVLGFNEPDLWAAPLSAQVEGWATVETRTQGRLYQARKAEAAARYEMSISTGKNQLGDMR